MRATGFRILLILGAAATATACSTYPDAPRYSTRADQPSPIAGQPPYPGMQPYSPPPAPAPNEAPPPMTAPVAPVEGGALAPVGGRPNTPATTPPAYGATPGYGATPPAYSPAPAAAAGSVYVIQSGDTISGVGRRFRTPVQSLIDLNALGPQASISAGQRLRLPAGAVDSGVDPYATGPAPVGVVVSGAGVAAPPPPPVRTQPPANLPPVMPPPLQPAPVAPSAPPATATNANFQWPVRGDVLRRFGPIGVGERNNGINIGASAGAPVVAASAGTVAYVGDALPGQGLTVLIVHRDGWRTVYGHLGSATVDDGDAVRAGQQIGTVGLTAGDGRPSMHFETRQMRGDDPIAIDPLTVLPR